MVGKDILRFHTVYWPAFLMARRACSRRSACSRTAGGPTRAEDVEVAGQRRSSRMRMVANYGLDPVRYFLLREMPFGNDGDFSHRAMVQRINSDLANDLGNLAQRVLSMINKNCGGAGAAARRLHRRRREAAGARRDGLLGQAAAADRGAGVPPGAGGDLAGGRRGQPLCRRAGALGAAQDRSGAHGDGALRAGRDDAQLAILVQPFMPDAIGEDARPARRCRPTRAAFAALARGRVR